MTLYSLRFTVDHTQVMNKSSIVIIEAQPVLRFQVGVNVVLEMFYYY